MKNLKKICIFVILSLVLCSIFTTVAFAAEAENAAGVATEAVADNKLDMDLKPESFGERAEIALQGTVTGMIMVFAVLGLLAIIMTISKVIFYDIPRKKREKASARTAVSAPADVAPAAVEAAPVAAPVAEQTTDDGELAAVITAAIAAMIESGDYKNEFVGGFRVVSFKRTSSGAWNRK